MQAEIPEFIGKYTTLGVLGRGSMGNVYKSLDPQIGRIVAIKVLRKGVMKNILSGDQLLERFITEARASGNLRHSNIVGVFEANWDEDPPYIVMDYIEGKGLDKIIAENTPLNLNFVLHVLSQVAQGLDYAHSKRVYHRDIKPSNILVDKNDNAVIADFGVAVIGQNQDPGEPIFGSPGYMSPEQIRNEQLDHRSDQFSLGVVAFECIVGKRPFPGKDFHAVVANILADKRYTISQVVPNAPEVLDQIFDKVFSQDKTLRFASCHEFINVLKESLGFISEKSPMDRKRREDELKYDLNLTENLTSEDSTSFIPGFTALLLGGMLFVLSAFAVYFFGSKDNPKVNIPSKSKIYNYTLADKDSSWSRIKTQSTAEALKALEDNNLREPGILAALEKLEESKEKIPFSILRPYLNNSSRIVKNSAIKLIPQSSYDENQFNDIIFSLRESLWYRDPLVRIQSIATIRKMNIDLLRRDLVLLEKEESVPQVKSEIVKTLSGD